jgi:hypothetical protein
LRDFESIVQEQEVEALQDSLKYILVGETVQCKGRGSRTPNGRVREAMAAATGIKDVQMAPNCATTSQIEWSILLRLLDHC